MAVKNDMQENSAFMSLILSSRHRMKIRARERQPSAVYCPMHHRCSQAITEKSAQSRTSTCYFDSRGWSSSAPIRFSVAIVVIHMLLVHSWLQNPDHVLSTPPWFYCISSIRDRCRSVFPSSASDRFTETRLVSWRVEAHQTHRHDLLTITKVRSFSCATIEWCENWQQSTPNV